MAHQALPDIRSLTALALENFVRGSPQEQEHVLDTALKAFNSGPGTQQVSISILRDRLKNGPTNFLPFYHTINELLKAEALGKLAMEGYNVVLQLLHAAEKLTIALDPEASGHQARDDFTSGWGSLRLPKTFPDFLLQAHTGKGMLARFFLSLHVAIKRREPAAQQSDQSMAPHMCMECQTFLKRLVQLAELEGQRIRDLGAALLAANLTDAADAGKDLLSALLYRTEVRTCPSLSSKLMNRVLTWTPLAHNCKTYTALFHFVLCNSKKPVAFKIAMRMADEVVQEMNIRTDAGDGSDPIKGLLSWQEHSQEFVLAMVERLTHTSPDVLLDLMEGAGRTGIIMGVMQHLNAAGPEGEQHVVTFMRHMLPRMHRLEGLSDAQIVLGMILNLTACVTAVWTVEEAICFESVDPELLMKWVARRSGHRHYLLTRAQGHQAEDPQGLVGFDAREEAISSAAGPAAAASAAGSSSPANTFSDLRRQLKLKEDEMRHVQGLEQIFLDRVPSSISKETYFLSLNLMAPYFAMAGVDFCRQNNAGGDRLAKHVLYQRRLILAREMQAIISCLPPSHS